MIKTKTNGFIIYLLMFLMSMFTAWADNTVDIVNSTVFKNTSGNLTAVGIVSAVVLIIVGLMFVFSGRRMVKIIIFLSGFVFFTFLILIICYNIKAPESGTKLSTWYYIGSLIGGLVMGGVMVLLLPLGLFIVGAFGGFTLATFIITMVRVGFSASWVRILFLGLMSVGVGLAAVFLERPIFIISTSVFGSLGVMVGVDMFTKKGFTDLVVSVFGGNFTDSSFNTPMIIMSVAFGVLAIIGIIVQFKTSHS